MTRRKFVTKKVEAKMIQWLDMAEAAIDDVRERLEDDDAVGAESFLDDVMIPIEAAAEEIKPSATKQMARHEEEEAPD